MLQERVLIVMGTCENPLGIVMPYVIHTHSTIGYARSTHKHVHTHAHLKTYFNVQMHTYAHTFTHSITPTRSLYERMSVWSVLIEKDAAGKLKVPYRNTFNIMLHRHSDDTLITL
jgi:hypothetical protein